MTMFLTYLTGAGIVFCYMLLWYILAQIKRDNGLADVAWGLGFVLLSGWIFFDYHSPTHSLLFAMVAIWGIRLSTYIFFRNRQKGEDWRYAAWRKEWGKLAPVYAFFKVFMLQGLMMWLIASPLLQIDGRPESNIGLSWIQYLGIALWLLGFIWEAIADQQLYQFKSKAKNKGKILTKGLWKYSRHPNYFGEIILWWGIFLYTLPFGIWYISLVSPLVVTWLLSSVSGVPMLEKKMKENPEYANYVKHTNALIPRFW